MSEPCWESAAEGILLRIRVAPKASANRFLGIHDGRLKVQVTAAPEKGKANRAVIALVADTLGIGARSCEVVAGAQARDKTIRLHGVTEGQIPKEWS
jgi:uncharacterized protein (TIGR00251 family)